MAVAHDAVSESHTGTTGDKSHASFTWNHIPVGTPRGILVFVFCDDANADNTTSVTYGGTTMTRVSGSLAADTTTEPGTVVAYFLGSSVPTGTQAVVVNRTNNANEMYAVAISVTAATDTNTFGVTLQQNDQAPAQANITDNSPGTNSVRYAAAHYGGSGVPIAGASSTALISIDFGVHTCGVVRETTAGQGSRPVGFADASDDWACVLLAVREAAPATSTPGLGQPTATGFAPTWSSAPVINAALGQATATGFAPTIQTPQNTTAGRGQVTATGFAPTVQVSPIIAPGVGAAVATGFAPTIQTPQNVAPGVGAIAATGFAPTIQTPQNSAPSVGAVTATGFAPTVQTPQNAAPGVGAVSAQGFAPTVETAQTSAPGCGQMQVTGYAPTWSSESLGSSVNAQPAAGELSVTGYAPTVETSLVIETLTGSFIVLGHRPRVVITGAPRVGAPRPSSRYGQSNRMSFAKNRNRPYSPFWNK